mgnify:CR=1 FL=1
MSETILEIKELKKSFGDNPILQGLSLQINKGEVVVILGPSGCGKSTLLRCLNGLESIQGGDILLDGQSIVENKKDFHLVRQKIGMVFQSYELFPHLDVLQNLILGPIKAQGRDKKEVTEEALQLLERVGLLDKQHSFARQLSGGQKQRVAIVRALLMHPEIILFDEVTASLDPEMVREVLELINDLAQEGRTMILVTHEMQFAQAIADRIIFLDQGKIAEEGTAQDFFTNPQTKRAQEFLNVFDFSQSIKEIFMKLLKPLLTVLALAFALIFVTACSSGGNAGSSSGKTTAKARTIDEIKKSGELRIAVFGDKKPFGYVDNDGSYQGYDIELGNQLAQDLGVKVKYVSVDAANRAEYLISNKVDITLANFTVTDERKKQVDFALPYMKVSLGVVSPKTGLITDVKQLEGKTLIVTKGTTAETYFEKNHPEVKLQKYDQYSDSYQALLDGRGDAFSTDNTEVLAWALENKGFEVGITSLGNPDTIAPAVQKGNQELLDFINKDIEKLGKENFFHKAYEKTLHPTYGDAAKADDLVVEGGKVD